MLNEFYDFIAKKIFSFFQAAAAEGTLLKGESFCLKLDDDEMVTLVTNALEEYATKNQAIGEYIYACRDGSKYETYTLKVIDNEVIIAAQKDGMTNDFLCATLRNAANDEQKPLLMISANPIDSAKSGSRDMSASGMPFYADQLMAEIRNMVNNSTQLTNVEKRILQFELKRRDADVFSDKASLYEYRDLLSIMSSGKIESGNYSGFRLFAVDGKADYRNYGNAQIDKEIKDNNDLFEKIDRGIRFGNLEVELARVFEDKMIFKIENAYRDEGENWSLLFTYAELAAAKERKQMKMENPLKIEKEDISVYGDLPLNVINPEEALIIRNEGSQTAKKRIKNILVFNSERYSKIHIQFNCNAKILNSGILADDSEMSKEGNNIIFKFIREGVTFHKLEINDSANDITYIFKVCIIDLAPEYMYQTVKHSVSIEYKKIKKNSRIKLVGVGINLIFNKNGGEVSSCKLQDNEIYSCKYGERLLIYSSEEELANLGSGIRIDINFSGVVVPFILYPDEVKSVEIIGRKILRDKLSAKKSFEFDNDAILGETQEYFAKANLLRELRIEQKIIDESIFCGNVKNFYVSDVIKIDKKALNLPAELEEAYLLLLATFKKEKTTPTLAYLGGTLHDSVVKYIEVFEKCFANLNDGENLSQEQEDALLLGTISIGRNEEEIVLTPFHPLNLRYQLMLLEEKGIEYATDIVMERLNSINLLPYIQKSKRIYKVSDQLYSQEWKYYAPVENKKYRGSRRYVSKLVEEKISEFLLHFKYIFDDINNKIIRINLINMGDCSEVFIGLAQFFIHAINRNADIDSLVRFEIHIYTDDMSGNSFFNIRKYSS
jgi:DNA phosphorothioation-dependent restriction protein DptH